MRGVRLKALYRRHFRDVRRERQFLASFSFFVTFAVTRAITHSMRDGSGPFRSIFVGDTHVHHLVWGILLLLVVGYAWLLQVGTGHAPEARRASRFMSIVYGVGAALTLDEFAMWLHLEDVYWDERGRASVDAVVLFGGLVSVGLWGGPFLRAVVRQLGRVWRRQRRAHHPAHHPASVTDRHPASAHPAREDPRPAHHATPPHSHAPHVPSGARQPGSPGS